MDVSKTGVYVIENLVNGKKYVGSAARSFKYRWTKHLNLLRRNAHPNIHIQNSYNKHGETAFKFDILGYYPPCFVLKAEQHFIDSIKPQYNKAQMAGSMLGFKHSEKTRDFLKKRSDDYFANEDNRKKHSEILKKAFSTEEYKKKLSERQKDYFAIEENRLAHKQRRKDHFLKEENRIITSIGQKKRFSNPEEVEKMRDMKSKFIYLIQIPSGEIIETTSLTFFAKQHNLNDGSLGKTLRGTNHDKTKCTQHKGYKVLSKTPRKK